MSTTGLHVFVSVKTALEGTDFAIEHPFTVPTKFDPFKASFMFIGIFYNLLFYISCLNLKVILEAALNAVEAAICSFKYPLLAVLIVLK